MIENVTNWMLNNPGKAVLLGVGTFIICKHLMSNSSSTRSERNGLQPIHVKRYQCSDCSELYMTRKEADDCCPNTPATVEYVCTVCDTQHKTETEARKCCPPDAEPKIKEVNAWKCPGCKETYEDK